MKSYKNFHRVFTNFGEEVYGELTVLETGTRALIDGDNKNKILVTIDEARHNVPYASSETLCKCTYHTDKNRKMLFENDRMNLYEENNTLDVVIRYDENEKITLHVIPLNVNIPFDAGILQYCEYTGTYIEGYDTESSC